MEDQLATILRIKNPPLGRYFKNKFELEVTERFFTNDGLILGNQYYPSEVLLKVKADQPEIAEKTSDELLKSVKQHCRKLKGIPEFVISDASDRYQPDMVLMETRKAGSEDGEFLNKIVMKVVQRSNYLVWAVLGTAVYPKGKKLNVMYATDFYDSDNSSLNKLLSILLSFEKEIHCIHIDLNDDPHHLKKVEQLNGMLEKEYKNYNIRCELFESSDMDQGFTDFVEKNNFDIISLLKQRRSAFYKMFHLNIPGKLLTTRKVPMLIFHL